MAKLPHPPDRLADLLEQIEHHAQRRDPRAVTDTITEARDIARNRARFVGRAP